MRKNYFFSFLILFFSVLASCNFNKNESKSEYLYKLVWSTKIEDINQITKPLQIDNFLFFIDQNIEQQYRLIKMDLNTGCIVGKSDILPITCDDFVSSNIYIYNNNIFFMDSMNYIYFYNKNTLQRVLWKRVGSEADFEDFVYNKVSTNIEIYNSCLYYGNIPSRSGKAIVKINIDNLFSCENDVFIPEFVNYNCYKSSIFNIKIHNGILYYVSNNALKKNEEKDIPVLYAWDLKSDSLLWQQKVEKEKCITNCALQVTNNKLVLLDNNFYSFDLQNGKILSSKQYKRTEPYTELTPNLYLFLSDMLVDDDKIYCTGNDTELWYINYQNPKNFVKNLYCIDSKKGNIVWSDLIEKTESSLDSLPLIIDDKLYILTYEGFRIYNKNNGSLLADFDNFGSDIPNRIFYYDKKFIFFDYKKDKKQGRYVAITITEDEN